jgi:hypothetical protein
MNMGKIEGPKNDDQILRRLSPKIKEERKSLGLDGLVLGLQSVVINVEPGLQKASVQEMMRYTGLSLQCAFQTPGLRTCVLNVQGSQDFRSADVLITSRLAGDNPFEDLNQAPKARHLPNTRLETFVFETTDLEKYFTIQKDMGFEFTTDDIVYSDNYSFIQTRPSKFTGNSLGFIQWNGKRGNYATGDDLGWDWHMPLERQRSDGSEGPKDGHLRKVKWIDHAATRVKAQDRNAAIIEFMRLTNYNFDMAIYVESLNSITSVARLSPSDFAMVFTSGISPYTSDQASGPTEKFIQNYGTRVHHIAFQTEEIEETYQALVKDGMNFLTKLVGSPEDGLRQAFSEPSANTLLVNEYIHRYGDFDGFFTKSNVTVLTAATDKQ